MAVFFAHTCCQIYFRQIHFCRNLRTFLDKIILAQTCKKIITTQLCIPKFTVPCKVLGRDCFRRAASITYISRQGMTSLDLCLQLIPSGQGESAAAPAAGTSWPRLAPPSLERSWRPLTLDGAGWNVLYLISYVN